MNKPISTLIVDQDALNILGSAVVDPRWFDEFGWPNTERIRRVAHGGGIYLLSEKADFNSRLLIVSAGKDGIFQGSYPQQILDRVIHVALSTFERRISVPPSWHPYNVGSLYSVYAYNHAKGGSERIYFSRKVDECDHVFAYALSENKDFAQVTLDIGQARSAIAGYPHALIADVPSSSSDVGAYGVDLSTVPTSSIVGSATLDEWYSRKLTDQQRAFVDKGYDEPVRLRGAAGTGKTLSMSIKFLRDLLAAEAAGEDKRVAFITHSASIAHDTIPAVLDALDPAGRWRTLKHSEAWIGSVYELAQSLLSYEQKGLRPLSIDGREGRTFQALIIADAIEQLKRDTRFTLRELPKCSDAFRSFFESAKEDSRFTLELMNEFGCVLDAENVRLGNTAAQKYLTDRRERWQMPLDSENDRRAVLSIHDLYRRDLEKSDIFSMDQMIADLNRYMQSHEWSRLKNKDGFDAIFVDELHFFNRAERMVFHNLFRPRATEGGKMPLFMSYDLKQSPADSFLGGGGSESAMTFFQRLRAGESQLVELTEVFRSTPQIATFLRDLDAAFPALDLESEWSDYGGESAKQDGSIPVLREYGRSVELLDDVFRRAVADAATLGGRNVAVLCMDDELYNRYLTVGRISGKYVELSGRDQIGQLKYLGKGKCVFSMPEYVAGLQFSSIYLIHVDRAEDDPGQSIGSRRRFVSKCYLGASRAAEKLEIAVCTERGGRSDVLSVPLERGSLLIA